VHRPRGAPVPLAPLPFVRAKMGMSPGLIGVQSSIPDLAPRLETSQGCYGSWALAAVRGPICRRWAPSPSPNTAERTYSGQPVAAPYEVQALPWLAWRLVPAATAGPAADTRGLRIARN
jgi:hypothetical protein